MKTSQLQSNAKSFVNIVSFCALIGIGSLFALHNTLAATKENLHAVNVRINQFSAAQAAIKTEVSDLKMKISQLDTSVSSKLEQISIRLKTITPSAPKTHHDQ